MCVCEFYASQNLIGFIQKYEQKIKKKLSLKDLSLTTEINCICEELNNSVHGGWFLANNRKRREKAKWERARTKTKGERNNQYKLKIRFNCSFDFTHKFFLVNLSNATKRLSLVSWQYLRTYVFKYQSCCRLVNLAIVIHLTR